MREIIQLNVGQAGSGIGAATWELYCQEHNIAPDGLVASDKGLVERLGARIIFNELPNGKYVPRTVFIDTDPLSINQIRIGAQRNLYHPKSLLSGKEDCCIYARGRYTIGKEHIESVFESVRKQAEVCDGMQGFMLNIAIGGGNTGLAANLIDKLQNEFKKTQYFAMPLMPSPDIQSSIIENYNAALFTSVLRKKLNCSFLIDNQAIAKIFHKNLDIQKPKMSSLNRLLAQLTSQITSSIRFEGTMFNDLTEFRTLCPEDNLSFLVPSYAPLVANQKMNQDFLKIPELTEAAVNNNNLLVSCESTEYSSVALLYRGDANFKDVNQAVANLKAKELIKYLDWAVPLPKVSVNGSIPSHIADGELPKISRSVSMIGHTPQVAQIFQVMSQKFDRLYSKRAFVHWYVGEGMEEGELSEAQEDIGAIIQDMEKLKVDDDDNQGGEEGNGEQENQQEQEQEQEQQNQEEVQAEQ